MLACNTALTLLNLVLALSILNSVQLDVQFSFFILLIDAFSKMGHCVLKISLVTDYIIPG